MGSQIVTMVTAQIGSLATEGGNNPGTSNSKPILQREDSISTVSPSQNIQQFIELQTGIIGGPSSSAPVQQDLPDPFPAQGLNAGPDDDSIMEQKSVIRDSIEGPDSPIEQQVYLTADLRDVADGFPKPVQQFTTFRNAGGDDPIEQTTTISNIVQINQFDFADSIFPACNSLKNPTNTNILWRIQDFGFPFDLDSLIFVVNGSPVDGASSFVVTVIAGGLEISYDPSTDFEFNSEVFIVLIIQDTADPVNRITYNCSWFTVPDTKLPLITLISPLCNQDNVDSLEPVVFDVIDAGRGVDLNTITLDIEGIPVCDGLTFDGVTTAEGTGFRGTYLHPSKPFRYQSNVTVAINATDLADDPNSSFFVCSFDVEQSSPPQFINIVPEPCSTFVDIRTGLRFEVYGDVDGVDISTLDVNVDNTSRKVIVQPRILRST